MFKYKKKPQILVLLILIIACAIKTNFFRNLAEVLLFKFEDRIENKYGFCSEESIGYLFYLKKKYQIYVIDNLTRSMSLNKYFKKNFT